MTTITGTISGTLLSMCFVVDVENIAKTIILAIIGATVSFIVSYFLDKHFRRKSK